MFRKWFSSFFIKQNNVLWSNVNLCVLKRLCPVSCKCLKAVLSCLITRRTLIQPKVVKDARQDCYLPPNTLLFLLDLFSSPFCLLSWFPCFLWLSVQAALCCNLQQTDYWSFSLSSGVKQLGDLGQATDRHYSLSSSK